MGMYWKTAGSEIIMPEIFFFDTLKQGKETNAHEKKGKTCKLFSLWKLTHYFFLFYEGNEDEIEDMDDERLDEDEMQSTGGQRSDDDASKSGGKKK